MLGAFGFALAAAAAGAINGSALLTRTPFLMAHDAGSGYLRGGLVDRWAQTQSGGLAEQLACGARAFDARPLNDKRRGLIWHHSVVSVDYPFARSLADVAEWAARNPAELVLFLVWDCEGDGCMAAVSAALAAQRIAAVRECDELVGLTYAAALARGARPGGGSVLAVLGAAGQPDGVACGVGNYDSTLDCTGVDGKGAYGCWSTDHRASYPTGRMLAYLDNVSVAEPRAGRFAQAQALWQSTRESVVLGTARNSSLLTDERNSAINAMVAAELRTGRWAAPRHFSLLEVNAVCDGGEELLAALRGDASD